MKIKRGEVLFVNCHQLRVLDKTRLIKRLGQLQPEAIAHLERILLFTLGYKM
jgi:mRNA interferase MazF